MPHPSTVLKAMLCLLLLTSICAVRPAQTAPEEDTPAGDPLADAPAVSPRKIDRAIERGASYLLHRQDADGGWKSNFWGLMKSGQSLTPLVLNVLARVPDGLAPSRPGIRKGFQFVRAHQTKNGAIGFTDSMVTDYPNYATALAISAFVRLKPDGWRASVREMVDYLVDQQLDRTHGWTPEHDAFGGWAMGKTPPPSPPSTVHADLSRVRYVLAALSTAEKFVPDGVFLRARTFILNCRTGGAAGEGGLVYTPVIPAENKAGSTAGNLRPYGSPTADGVLALQSAGVSRASGILTGALSWIDRQHRVEAVPGLDRSGGARWDRGLRFYYLASVARVFRTTSSDRIRRPNRQLRAIAEVLVEQQKTNGRWENTSPLNRENDPLIATAFALHALVDARAMLAEQR